MKSQSVTTRDQEGLLGCAYFKVGIRKDRIEGQHAKKPAYSCAGKILGESLLLVLPYSSLHWTR